MKSTDQAKKQKIHMSRNLRLWLMLCAVQDERCATRVITLKDLKRVNDETE